MKKILKKNLKSPLLASTDSPTPHGSRGNYAPLSEQQSGSRDRQESASAVALRKQEQNAAKFMETLLAQEDGFSARKSVCGRLLFVCGEVCCAHTQYGTHIL